jgi:branched-chain amino acid transport system substrate-binding protein
VNVPTPSGRRRLLRAATAIAALPMLRAPFAATPEPFRIASLTPISGAGAPYGEAMRRMIVAAADEINAAGGALGRRFEVYVEDTRTDPDLAVDLARHLIAQYGVQAILGTWSTDETSAVLPLLAESAVIQMTTAGAPELSALTGRDLLWRFQSAHGRIGRAFAAVCKRRGFRRPATMAIESASGAAIAGEFRSAWSADGGRTVADVVYPPRASSYRDHVARVADAQPDVVVLGSYLPDATAILREWKALGAATRWLMPGWVANVELIAALGAEACEGIVSVDTVANERAPSFARFEAQYRRAMRGPGTDNVHAAMAYDMTVVLALAIEAAGPGAGTREINARIREVCSGPGEVVYGFEQGQRRLRAGRAINYDGASSRLEFDAHGDADPDLGVYVIEQGKLIRRQVISL